MTRSLSGAADIAGSYARPLLYSAQGNSATNDPNALRLASDSISGKATELAISEEIPVTPAYGGVRD
jgi:hypothetical protein